MEQNNIIPIDLVTNTKNIIIYANLCGVKREDVEIEICGETIMIKGQRKQIMQEGFKTSQLLVGKIMTTVKLEQNIDPEKTIIEYEDGLLTIRLFIKEHKTYRFSLMNDYTVSE